MKVLHYLLLIQEYLCTLSRDFGRLQNPMGLPGQAYWSGPSGCHHLSTKITNRFEKIEKVELEEEQNPDLPVFRKATLLDAENE
jgi:hypothetical protein